MLVVHISLGNKVHLLFRVLSLAAPMIYSLCYPMSLACKAVTLAMHTGRKVSVWCIVILSWYRWCKLKKTHSSSLVLCKLERLSKLYLLLGFHWLAWALIFMPFLILIPETLDINSTQACDCSVADAMERESGFIVTYSTLYLTVLQYTAAACMTLFNVKTVHILLKRRASAETPGTVCRLGREKDAAMVLVALVSLYNTCIILHTILTFNLRGTSAAGAGRVAFDIYASFIPYVITLGQQTFRGWLSRFWVRVRRRTLQPDANVQTIALT
ncbi:UNVERIFIED_CONTAM: hypothetical protein FKN15_007515 [Acipenser sinensis]